MTRLYSYCIFIFWLGLAACHKDNTPTIINGTITDAKTGMPIQGVRITYSPYVPGKPQGTFSINTNSDGKFTITLAQQVEGFSGLTVEKSGYVPKFSFGTPFKNGVVNDFQIIMHPRDAVLRLIYENTSNQEKSVYTQARSSTFSDEYGVLPYIITHPYPYKCQPNSRDTVDYPITSDEQIGLFWDFVNYANTEQATYRDSLFLIRGDTAIYNISF